MRDNRQQAKSTDEKFWEKVSKTESANECWEWTACVNNMGYGQMQTGLKRLGTARREYAHRISWKLAGNGLPSGVHVLHRCDNPRCVNPNHLFLGSQFDNIRDCIRKRRNTFGEKHPAAKLRDFDVMKIRNALRAGIIGNQKELAKQYGVSQATITRIKKLEGWKHLEDQAAEESDNERFPEQDFPRKEDVL